MSMTHRQDVLKSEIAARLADLEALVNTSFHEGRAIHDVERGIWTQLLQLGRHYLEKFIALHGSGDVGETVTLDDQEWQRLDDWHSRRYVSIFGELQLQRTVYGTREGQKIEYVRLDQQLQLPAGAYSYVLQDWDQALCVEEAFGQVQTTIARMLQLKQPVGSLEHMNREMAGLVSEYLVNRPVPLAAQEGELVVASADGKGIVMRREPGDEAPKAHRSKGDKASQKRMATVGTVYTVDRYVRTPEQVLAALFRDESERSSDRPRPQSKEVWASLPQDERWLSGQEAVFTWLDWEVRTRNPGQEKETVYLCDGQETLWQDVAEKLPTRNSVEILDLLHVTPRLWKAAHVFLGEGSKEVEPFVRQRVLRVLQGQASGVIRGLREMATKRALTGSKKKTIREICGYLEKNLERLRYDQYLAAGYPIASGAIEGACRHLVKDRMERAGMHWTAAGAQAMLDLRSVFVSGQWQEYQAYRIERERQKLYPYRPAAEPVLRTAL